MPEARREFAAPAGRFVFVVSTPDNWKSPHPEAQLFAVTGSARSLLWSRQLPQQFGPRFVVVNDAGTVLMLDEWINVNTKFAVLIVDRSNQTVAEHSTDDVQAALRVPMNQVVQMAKSGWWITAPPESSPTGDIARVQAAGKILTIRLSDGRLSVS